MNRRTFFKRVAATCAAVVVAPATLATGKKLRLRPVQRRLVLGACDSKIKGRTTSAILYDEFARLDLKKFKGWKYYGTYEWNNDRRELVLVEP
jgi:hypothetical protein